MSVFAANFSVHQPSCFNIVELNLMSMESVPRRLAIKMILDMVLFQNPIFTCFVIFPTVLLELTLL